MIIIASILLIALVFSVCSSKYLKYIKYVYYYVFPTECIIQSDYILNVDTDTLCRLDSGYGDWLVHPCVRYIPEGLGGHKWWMAVTPYPEGNNKYEQPVLYYGDNNGSTPPQKWNYFGMIQNMQEEGYNADPNLYYDEMSKILYIIWKETRTPNTSTEFNGNAIMYRTFDGVSFGPIQKLFDNCSEKEVFVTAPTLIQVKDSIYCFATKFEHERIAKERLPRGKCGIAVWKNDYITLDSVRFHYSKYYMPSYPDGFDYWHTEFVYDKEKKLFYSVVTNEDGFDVLVGVSTDGFNYTYSDTPLISFRGKGHPRNLYKASIAIVGDNLFFFYPKRSSVNRSVHIYCASINKQSFLDYFE